MGEVSVLQMLVCPAPECLLVMSGKGRDLISSICSRTLCKLNQLLLDREHTQSNTARKECFCSASWEKTLTAYRQIKHHAFV